MYAARWTQVLGCLAAVALLGAARCPNRKAAAKASPSPVTSSLPDSADQVIYGLRTVLSDQSVAKGLLLSDTAFVYDDGGRLVMQQVHVTFYTAQGIKDGVMTSLSGIYNSRLSRLEARGNVVVTRDDGTRLTSPQLVYDQARNQIFTDSAFVLNEPTRSLSGIGFESDPRMTSFRCIKGCKAVVPVQIPRQ